MASEDGFIQLRPVPSAQSAATQIFFDRSGKGVRIRQPFLSDTHGGGGLEEVPGFDKARARRVGLALPMPDPPHPSLPDAPVFESVFGVGDPLVPVNDTSAVPFRSIAFLDITYTDHRMGSGTGWFAGPKTVVTAAHCLVEPGFGSSAATVSVLPGFFGLARGFVAARLFVPPEWTRSVAEGRPDIRFDWALIYLADPDVGRTVGWFGLAAPPDTSLDALLLNIAGYLRPRGPQFFDGGRLAGFDDDFLFHRFDTDRGMSGSPIIVKRDDRRYAVGIHHAGDVASNRALRINDRLFDAISSRLE